MKRNMIFFTMFVFSLLIIAGCSQNTSTSKPTATQVTPASGNQNVKETVVEVPDTESQDIKESKVSEEEIYAKVVEIDMIAKQWEFIPETVTVNLGDKLDIHVKSIDVSHGFMLPEFGINERLDPGKEVHIEFVADKKGTFTYACSVPCGRGHGGMAGKLIVK